METPKTLQQVIRYFADEETCIQTVASMRWPDGPECPACGKKEHYYLKTQKRWKCKECWKQFSVKVGTIFEDSPLGLEKWLTAMWLIANCKNGVSSCEVARDLGITQKSAWFMLHRIRKAMQDGSLVKVGGPGSEVEVDETFIGGKARNMHKERRIKTKVREGNWGKTIVMGMLERGGHVKAKVVANRRKPALHAAIAEHVEKGTQLYTDEHNGYMDISPDYVHSIVNHLENYVDGRVHTNGMENFWSLLKRGIGGTYVSVEPFHLFRYVDEQAYRFNNRKKPMTDSARFYDLLSRVAGRRVTYSELTGKLCEEAF
jgi:transposase-like protein